jgi:hypothetical protein
VKWIIRTLALSLIGWSVARLWIDKGPEAAFIVSALGAYVGITAHMILARKW